MAIAAAPSQPVEREQASARGAVVAGAEGQRRLDLDADAVGSNARAVMRAVHHEASGLDRGQSLQARLDPIGRRDAPEDQRIGGLGSGREPDQGAHRRLIGRVAKVEGHCPQPVPLLRGRHHHVAGIEGLGQRIKDVPRLRLAGRDAGPIAWIRGGHGWVP
jgi:hypothetical protein